MNVKGTFYVLTKTAMISGFGEERWNSFMTKLVEKDNYFSKMIMSITLIPVEKLIIIFDEMCNEFFNNDRMQYLMFGKVGAKYSSVAIETAVRQEDVAVRIESEEVAEGLDSDDCAGDGIIFRNRLLEKNLQGFPGAAAEGGKEFSIIQKVATKNLRNTEYVSLHVVFPQRCFLISFRGHRTTFPPYRSNASIKRPAHSQVSKVSFRATIPYPRICSIESTPLFSRISSKIHLLSAFPFASKIEMLSG